MTNLYQENSDHASSPEVDTPSIPNDSQSSESGKHTARQEPRFGHQQQHNDSGEIDALLPSSPHSLPITVPLSPVANQERDGPSSLERWRPQDRFSKEDPGISSRWRRRSSLRRSSVDSLSGDVFSMDEYIPVHTSKMRDPDEDVLEATPPLTPTTPPFMRSTSSPAPARALPYDTSDSPVMLRPSDSSPFMGGLLGSSHW
mmetsp:Transcript_50937/g.101290  ORF Transcript_50937/g.101290 Transcript_50937/m.101290 type:complete len:201 (-) Transcript_50937:237-839(-)|eukprot:CAMPEP_0174731324 /NCGR_PEP_ID=MMETSP1094-20130205/57306_1 /TAXON_ID=156173 /ORGANISM="Chrysochromulina brevifilum, Strain UTEX LB 985" /LENGTH=200 /DNA_ID=CAMNT_0015933687 /DNA_START=40 /DNA_END=642 /DNA_ORIENTATION=+